MKIDFGLLKELREMTEWLLAFPTNLVAAALGPREEYLRRLERINKLKEIVEVREILKEIQMLYISKGSIVSWIKSVQDRHQLNEIKHVKELFVDVKTGVGNLRQAISESSGLNAKLGADAAIFLARVDAAYTELSTLPDETLMNDAAILEIAALLENIMETSGDLLRRLDEYKQTLEDIYGDQ